MRKLFFTIFMAGLAFVLSVSSTAHALTPQSTYVAPVIATDTAAIAVWNALFPVGQEFGRTARLGGTDGIVHSLEDIGRQTHKKGFAAGVALLDPVVNADLGAINAVLYRMEVANLVALRHKEALLRNAGQAQAADAVLDKINVLEGKVSALMAEHSSEANQVLFTSYDALNGEVTFYDENYNELKTVKVRGSYATLSHQYDGRNGRYTVNHRTGGSLFGPVQVSAGTTGWKVGADGTLQFAVASAKTVVLRQHIAVWRKAYSAKKKSSKKGKGGGKAPIFNLSGVPAGTAVNYIHNNKTGSSTLSLIPNGRGGWSSEANVDGVLQKTNVVNVGNGK